MARYSKGRILPLQPNAPSVERLEDPVGDIEQMAEGGIEGLEL